MLEEKVSEVIVIETEESLDEEYKIDFEKLKEINNQIVAYLQVNGTKIEYAVVQAKDNNYRKKTFSPPYIGKTTETMAK